MIFRSLFPGILAANMLVVGHANAQVLLCPSASELEPSQTEAHAEAKVLLERLLIALDLRNNEGTDTEAILRAHAETPGALLAKLGNVADRCNRAYGNDLEVFFEAVPGLRQAFLEAVLMDDTSSGDGHDAALAELRAAQEVEHSTDLSVRSLWRKLWFRTPSTMKGVDDRWAVIVASPADADDGWDKLGEFQEAWEDVYFQLHQPYYDDSSYHAIVVGKKLPHEEAQRLLEYVKELGMADDSYAWPVPVDDRINVVSSEEATGEHRPTSSRKPLDLGVLKN